MVIYFSILFLAPLTMFLFFCIPLSCTNSAWYLRDSKNQRINKKTKREEKKPNLQFIFATYNIYIWAGLPQNTVGQTCCLGKFYFQ